MVHLLWILPLCAFAWTGIAARAFRRRVRETLSDLRSATAPAPDTGSVLPDAVRRFSERAGLAPDEGRRYVEIEQAGEMRTEPGRPWLQFHATQVFAVGRPEFAWVARFRMFGLPLRVVDALGPSTGSLDARLLDAIPVARATGPAVTKGQLMRYLAELAWCPRAVTTNRRVRFEALPDGTVRARCEHAGVEAHVDLRFDAAGDLVAARGLRPRSTPTGPVDTPWLGRFSDHREIGGVRVPTRGEVAWVIDGEEFVYWRGQVTSLRAV